MNHNANNQIRKFLYWIVFAGMIVSFCFGMSGSLVVRAQEAGTTALVETGIPPESIGTSLLADVPTQVTTINGGSLPQAAAMATPLPGLGGNMPGQARQTTNELWFMPEATRGSLSLQAQTIKAASVGGPDDFGYTWDDSVALSWIDTSSGANTGLTGNGQNNATQVPLPFTFKYYENSYTSLYISAAGYLSFTDNGNWPNSGSIPSPSVPNNVIAPYWAPTYIGSGAWVHYSYGGSTPNRFFVVEWHNLAGGAPGAKGENDSYQFETILYENGDIVFQYGTNTYNSASNCGGAAGIENSTGQDGLYYFGSCNRAPSNLAVRYYRPADSARVFVTAAPQGQFTSAGGLASFHLNITNTGTLGVDTYDLTRSSAWTTSVYAADGTTLLTDTDSDGTVDTGSVPQGSLVTITVKVQTPGGAVLGNSNTAILTARSKVDTSRSKTASLKTAVPAPFVEGFEEDSYAVSLNLAQPRNQLVADVPGTCGCGENVMAIAKMTGETYIYTWWRGQWVVPPPYVPHSHIEYAILDNTGTPIVPVTWLTDNASTTNQIYDKSPAVAVTPDGHMGIMWPRQVYNADKSQVNINLFFAILDAAGQVVWGPTNITNDSTYVDSGVWPDTYSQNQVSATTDNHFLLAWQYATQSGGGTVRQIDYAIRDSAGNSVKNITKLSDSGVDGFQSANAVSGNQTILTWLYNSDLYYAVLDSSGNVTKAATNLTNDGRARSSSDAVLLSDGTTAIAWANYDGSYPGKNQLAFAILDGSYNQLHGPTSLNNPVAPKGNDAISITADGQAHAILTWSGPDGSRTELYYALVNSSGSVITQPMTFLTARNPQIGFQVNWLGYGNAPYDITTPPTVASITRANDSPTDAASVNFTVKFSEPVTGVDASDFTFTTSGITGASVTGVSGSHAIYTVTVNTGIGDGTLRLNLIDNDSIIDSSGNPLGGTGAGNGNFTTGQTYMITRHHIYLPLLIGP